MAKQFKGLKDYLNFHANSKLTVEQFHAIFNANSKPRDKKIKKFKQTLYKFKYQDDIDRAFDGANQVTLTKKRKNSPPRVLIMQTLYESMVRVSEFVQLEIQDLNVREATLLVRFGKGGKQRLVPISNTLAIDLKDYIDGRSKGPIFLSSWGKMYTPRYIQKICKEVSEYCGFEPSLTPHIFRHSHATYLLNASPGVDIAHLQTLLGHSDINTTTIYARSLPGIAIKAYRAVVKH
ncbi:MAG: integrase/recombinase XerD [Candidatus Omnitrophota bacterium]|jgi:integrase/recombinase XerD